MGIYPIPGTMITSPGMRKEADKWALVLERLALRAD